MKMIVDFDLIVNFSPTALQIMPGYHGYHGYPGYHKSWIKWEYSLPQTLNLSSQNVSKEVLLTGPKIQAKNPSHFGDCV